MVAIDLTPLLPGGQNGGAKVFVLELIRGLAAAAPDSRLVLLTQASSHDELAALDAPNVKRELVLAARTSERRARLFSNAGRWLRHFPRPIQRALAGLGYRVNAGMKRGGAKGLLRRIQADLLFCPFTAPAYREPGIPVVSTIYDLQFRAFPQFFAVEDLVQRELAFREACDHADALIAISDFSRSAAIAEGGVDPARVTTVHLRLRVAPADGRAGESLSRLGLEPGEYVIYPANFWKHKNHEALFRGFAQAFPDGPGAMRLVLTGAFGDEQMAISRAAREMGIASRVVFAGFVSQQELAALMAGARALVFPSLYEGFGLPVIEAMARGVPVACSNASALPEIAAGAAVFFDPRSPDDLARALASVCNDAGLRGRLIEAGRRRAAGFVDTQRMADEHWAIFSRVVAGTGRRAA